MITLSKKSRDRLKGVHDDLIAIVERAAVISDIDFMVGEGLRSKDRQRQLVEEGRSKTMNSRHLTGHAVDLWVMKKGVVVWDKQSYIDLSKIVLQAAEDLGFELRWGGDWDGDGNIQEERFFDGPHYELPRTKYP